MSKYILALSCSSSCTFHDALPGRTSVSWVQTLIYVSYLQGSSVQFSRAVVANSLRPRELQHTRPPCPSAGLPAHATLDPPLMSVWNLKSPASSWCCSVAQPHPTLCNPMGLHYARLPCPSPSPRACSIHVHWVSDAIQPSCPLSSPSPASGSFLMSQLFISGGQSIRASASTSILLMNIQYWFPLAFTGLVSLLSKGLSRVFSKPQLKSFKSLAFRLLYGPALTSVHDYWRNYSFD